VFGKSLVFVAMPFGRKPDVTKSYEIDFDDVYERGIKAALAPLTEINLIRADEERGGGFIHIPMFARLLLAEVTIVDVTVENANVFYELGVRHTARPRSTIIITAREAALPFDIAALRALPYKLENGVLTEENAQLLRAALLPRVQEALTAGDAGEKDSPLFQLFKNYPGVPIDPAEIDPEFGENAVATQQLGSDIASARSLSPSAAAVSALRELQGRVLTATPVDPALVHDLVLAFRSQGAYDDITALIEAVPEKSRTVPLREQYALALSKRNRPGERQKAIAQLKELYERIPSSETAGLIGSAYKSSMDDARAATPPDDLLYEDNRENAIEWYRRGFEFDPRDYYPGVVLLELLAVGDSAEDRAEFDRLLPVVQYAVERKGGVKADDYWVAATALELAVFANDWTLARTALRNCVGLGGTSPDLLSTTLTSLRRISLAQLPMIDATRFSGILDELDKRVHVATDGVTA
jgi:tetratricopeptide (TPR) repeat protein